MGRHTSEVDAGSGNGRRVAVVIVGLLLLALLAFFILPLFNGDDGGGDDGDGGAPTTPPASTSQSEQTTDTAPTSAASTEDATDTSEAAPTSEAPTSEDPTTEDSTSENAAPSGPPPELTACAGEVAAGQELASVANVGASNWKSHFTASVDYNAGDITLDEANDIFNTTKANVAQEVEDYEAARAAYDEATGGCTELAAADVDEEFTDAAASCTARAEALSNLAATADKVNADWAAHGAMMASKAEQDINDYMEEWHHDVAAAPENMDPYDDAVAALEAAPPCSVG